MCCDWLDVLVGSAGGFSFGCLVTAMLCKYFVKEHQRQLGNIHARTELKNAHLGEWK